MSKHKPTQPQVPNEPKLPGEKYPLPQRDPEPPERRNIDLPGGRPDDDIELDRGGRSRKRGSEPRERDVGATKDPEDEGHAEGIE